MSVRQPCLQSIQEQELKNINGGWYCILDTETPTGRISFTRQERSYLLNNDFILILDEKTGYVKELLSPNNDTITPIQLVTEYIEFKKRFAGVIRVN